MQDLDESLQVGTPETVATRQWVVRGVVLAVLVILVALLARRISPAELVELAQGWLDGLGSWGPWLFVTAYAVATVLFVPASALTLAAGALFGLLRGTIIVSAGSTLGAALAFLAARYLVRAQVEGYLTRHPRLASVDRAVGKGGWRVVALLRLSPAVPFNIQNYLYGVTSIPFRTALLTSWIAMLPGTVMYVYLGVLLGEGVRAAAGSSDVASAGKWAFLAVGLVATVGLTVYLTRLARRALTEEVGKQDLEEEPT